MNMLVKPIKSHMQMFKWPDEELNNCITMMTRKRAQKLRAKGIHMEVVMGIVRGIIVNLLAVPYTRTRYGSFIYRLTI